MAEAGIDSGAARASLPGTLQYGRVRPVFARARDVRVAPTTGFTTYISGNEITWNLPTGNDMWMDQRNSYITCDFGVHLGGNSVYYGGGIGAAITPGGAGSQLVWMLGDGTVGHATTEASAINAAGGQKMYVRFDGDTGCFIREWKTYINGVMVEDFERPNLLIPLLTDVHSDAHDLALRMAAAGHSNIINSGSMGSCKMGGSNVATANVKAIVGENPLAAAPAATNTAGMPGVHPIYDADTLNDQYETFLHCNALVGAAAALVGNSNSYRVFGSIVGCGAAAGTSDIAVTTFSNGPSQYCGNRVGGGGPNKQRMASRLHRPGIAECVTSNPHWLIQNMAINPPSSVVGTGTDRMLPLAFFQSVRCVWTMEYAHIALNITCETDTRNKMQDGLFPAWANYPNSACTYVLGNLYWYIRIIELDGDVLSFVADAYASGGVPRFLFPMEQWIHKYTTVAAGTMSATIPFNFNITSAKGVIAILRMDASELHGSNSTMASFCLTDRFGGFHLQDWQLTINGRTFPEYGPVQHFNASSFVTGNGSLLCADSLYKALGAVAGNIAAHTPGRISLTDWQGEGTYPLCLTGGGGGVGGTFEFKKTPVTLAPNIEVQCWNMMGGPSGAFFIGLPLEPADITEGSTTRAGVRLSAANDVSLRYTVRSNAAGHGITSGADMPAIRVDVYVLADTEFAFEQGAVTKIGAS